MTKIKRFCGSKLWSKRTIKVLIDGLLSNLVIASLQSRTSGWNILFIDYDSYEVR